MTTPTQISESYFTAWQEGDFDALRALLADDVDFVGAMGAATGPDACLDGLRGIGRVLDRIDVRVRVDNGTDVVTWFDLHTSVAPPIPTANWSRVEDGRITAIRVTFDPRTLISGLEAREA